MFVNIHTHQGHLEGIWSIQNIHETFDSIQAINNYSVGIHPWHIDKLNWKENFTKLKIASKNNHILAIGECGLDRLCVADFKLQEEIFIQHIKWANEIAKPLIIHCVRAHDEVLQLLKDYQCNVPVIFHGFNNKKELAEKIIKSGYYLSFGKALFNPGVEIIFNDLPLEKIFFETDDSDSTIESVYQQAGRIKNISLEQLSLQLKKNAQKVFHVSSF